MKILKTDLICITILTFFASLLVADQFFHPGEAATFDSQIHITNIANFSDALKAGDFPVAWADSFANYGLPTPIVSQQLTNYLGAFLNVFTQHPLTAYKLTLLLGSIFSSICMYLFLRIYTSPVSSLTGSLLFTFSAYRIFNVYVRGAMPEFIALGFIPLSLILIHMISNKKSYAIPLFILCQTLLILTHPFVFLIAQFIVIPYMIYSAYITHQKSILIWTFFSYTLALGISAYYLVPLLFEIKYFVISRNETQFVFDQFLNWKRYFSESWPYFTSKDIFVRGNVVQFGVLETLTLLLGSILLLVLPKNKNKKIIWLFVLPTALLLIILTLKISQPLYLSIPYLGSIQFPWRMLTALLLLPPFVLALLLDQIRFKYVVATAMMLIIIGIRLPQTYGKNYTYYPISHYHKTIKNLHFDSMNTIWTGKTTDYPVKTKKGEIIEGDGEILARVETNSFRKYQIRADSKLRLIDNTFYFPGWKVYANDQEIPIQFQDPNHRGVITYELPSGEHAVEVKFVDTKIRLVGKSITALSLLTFALFTVFNFRYQLFKKFS